jgi:ribonuclease VapC
MIVIDTSAIIAILEAESDYEKFLDVINRADERVLSAVSYQKAGFVIFGLRSRVGVQKLNAFLLEMRIEIIPHDERLAQIAITAFQRYGKGIHAKARLNLGDCAAYALAASLNAPLLYKGSDFAATDLISAV